MTRYVYMWLCMSDSNLNNSSIDSDTVKLLLPMYFFIFMLVVFTFICIDFLERRRNRIGRAALPVLMQPLLPVAYDSEFKNSRCRG